MGLLAARHADWLAQLRAGAQQPPARPRVPLWWRDAAIGSVEPEFLDRIGLASDTAGPLLWRTGQGWHLGGELTATLGRLALALREAGLAHAWRDEQLAVRDAQGRMLGTVERAVVRPLGIATSAVHLLALAPHGEHWVQRRALTKANDPGLWDTLMGGMVPATDTPEQALARETWEEAGLRLEQLRGLAWGGRLASRRPRAESRGGGGYVVEHIDWWTCVVPDGVWPANQDGEVDEFRLMPADEVVARLLAGEFTTEAALLLAAAGL
ncbi:NUDIX hydrolase [Ramlibacter tataouinensis]|uniref:Nudix hydrolase-like protein n=1 Tax=Ramlibacter tataouinensis (strain ATCC BAA-407 / DSM 14655 / LMG 21543 / TTB310) TaxID=365046 RepID=F5XXF9_RAMTT|nr:NUDIX domain-containing protein [Ramlibacter tataouinensis]AEG94294.1 Nudix hydrolase-like protein [Ramlibacter tataouinensis TTB310]